MKIEIRKFHRTVKADRNQTYVGTRARRRWKQCKTWLKRSGTELKCGRKGKRKRGERENFAEFRDWNFVSISFSCPKLPGQSPIKDEKIFTTTTKPLLRYPKSSI